MATSFSICGPHLTNDFYVSSESTTKRHLDHFSCFCADDHRVSLYFTMGRPFPLSKFSLPMGGSGPPSSTWFPGPTQVLNSIGISIGAAIFAGFTSVTDRPTDQATQWVTIGHIYVRSSAMRHNNNSNNNNLIYNVHSVEIILNRQCRQSPGDERRIIITKWLELELKLMFKGSHCSGSFVNGVIECW